MTRASVSVLAAAAGLAVLVVAPAAGADCASFEVEGAAITAPLVPGVPDPEHGREVAADPDRGDCTICHRLPLPEPAFHGTVGPSLVGIGSRRDAGELRAKIAAGHRLFPDSVMPEYCTSGGRYRVAPQFAGEPILTAREIENLIAWLLTLTTPEGPAP